MSGIFYDPKARKLHAVEGTPEAGWTLVTHNLNAGVHQCRRILREWVSPDDIWEIDWEIKQARLTA